MGTGVGDDDEASETLGDGGSGPIPDSPGCSWTAPGPDFATLGMRWADFDIGNSSASGHVGEGWVLADFSGVLHTDHALCAVGDFGACPNGCNTGV